MHGFQLWANLPAPHKMMDPRYRERDSAPRSPRSTLPDGATVKVICGTVGGVRGPGARHRHRPGVPGRDRARRARRSRHPTPRGHTVFAYVIERQRRASASETDPFSYEAEGAELLRHGRAARSSATATWCSSATATR